MFNIYYANPLSGPGAGGIAWFDMINLYLTPGNSVSRTYDLGLGYTASFTITNISLPNVLTTLSFAPVPIYSQAPFGNVNYTSINGNVGLIVRPVYSYNASQSALQISNISVLDPSNNPINNYEIVVADAETTNVNETLELITDGDPWAMLINIPPVTPPPTGPTISGIGTNIVKEIGSMSSLGTTAPVFYTKSPSNITALFSGNSSLEVLSIGIAFSVINLRKVIENRLDPSDQFKLDIDGPTSDSATTSGNSNGLQEEFASVWFNPGETFVLNESMAIGSASSLLDYNVSVQAVNQNPNGTTPPIGPLPITIEPQFGDHIIYTITNSTNKDFGDAPDTSALNGPGDYSTLLQHNGPRHGVTKLLTLGNNITSEPNAYQNPTATGDDISLGVQDDGLSVPVNPIIKGSTTYTLNVKYLNNLSVPATLYGWVDFNKNGIFELQEAATIPAPVTPNMTTSNLLLTFNVPTGFNLMPGDKTFIRLRLTTDQLINTNTSPTQEDTRSLGLASNGEVEDYIVNVIELKIEGVVWQDLNCNGIKESNEPGVNCAEVSLYNANNNLAPMLITTTDSNGYYSFSTLPRGKFYVKIKEICDFCSHCNECDPCPHCKYKFTTPKVYTTEGINSDVDVETGKSDIILIDENNPTGVINAGICKCLKISGQAFFDCNKNGLLDPSEPFLCDVTVILYNSLNEELQVTKTNCNGYYEFNGLSSGNYNIKFIAPSDMTFTTQNLNYFGSKPNASGISAILLQGDDLLNQFVGFTGTAEIIAKYCSLPN